MPPTLGLWTRLAKQPSVASRLPCQLTNLRSFASQPSTDGGVVSPLVYCVQQVQNYDRENYVWIGQSRKELRPALFALHAFNVETALIPEQVTQPTLAEVRFQWWREAIDSMKGGSLLRHPVIQALAQVIGDASSMRYRLQRIITTREADFSREVPPRSLADLEGYAEGSASQLQALQLDLAEIRNSDADHAASHLGKAIGIAAVLRGTARHASKRRTYLPDELTAREGVSQEAIFRGQDSEGLRNVVFEVAALAKGHLKEARRLQAKLPQSARELMLGAVACGLFLDALEKQNFDVFGPKLQNGGYSPLWHVLNTKYCAMRGTF